MSFILNSKIADAVKNYALTDTVSTVPVSFSEEFEDKMERFIKRKQRSRKIILISQRVALAAVIIALAGSWMYLMALPRYDEGFSPLSPPQQEGSNLEQEQPHDDTPYDTPDDDLIVPKPLPEPSGLLVIRNDEVNMGVDSGLRQGITSWDEARDFASFDLREPTVLPEGTQLRFIELLQTGENGSYPCVAALYAVSFRNNSALPAGMWHLYFFQYYLGSSGSIELIEDDVWVLPTSGGYRNIAVSMAMEAEPAETVKVGEAEVMIYAFSLTNSYDVTESSEFFVLHWVQNDTLFRILAPTGYADGIASFSFEELLTMVESIIRGN